MSSQRSARSAKAGNPEDAARRFPVARASLKPRDATSFKKGQAAAVGGTAASSAAGTREASALVPKTDATVAARGARGAGSRSGSLAQSGSGRSGDMTQRNYAPLLHGYTQRPVVPAKNYDVVSFAKAMNDDFAPRVQALFKPEVDAALAAQQTGVYVSWRLPDQKFDCQRVNNASRCFCGHSLLEHDRYNGNSVRVPCAQPTCRCRAFEWIPSRPEDVGEFWFQRRRDFDVSTWRAKCRCKHGHHEHDASGGLHRRCMVGGCRCTSFESNFLCAACDKHWEEHQTFFETEATRKRLGLPYGEAYLPFAEMPNLRDAALTGNEADDSVYRSLLEGPNARPSIMPRPVGNQAAVPSARSPDATRFRPVYD